MKIRIENCFAVLVGVCLSSGLASCSDIPSSYVGVWRGGASGLAQESYLVIRGDSTGGAFGVSEQGNVFKAYEFNFTPSNGVLRSGNRWSVRNGKRRDYRDGACAIWLDHDAGKLLMSDGRRTNSFDRAEGVEDPFRRSPGKSRKELVTGVWSGGSEFNAHTMVFAENGDAGLFFSVAGVLGKWALTDDGNVCVTADFDGVFTNVVVNYDAAEDTMRWGENAPIGRNVRKTPEEALKPCKDRILQAQRERQRRKDEFMSDKVLIVETNAFKSVSEIFDCLTPDIDDDFVLRSIQFETGKANLFEIFYQSSRSVQAYVWHGYAETGPAPKCAGMSNDQIKYARPPGTPVAQSAFLQGVAEMKSGAKAAGASCREVWRVHSQDYWCSWTEGIYLDWLLEKDKNKAIAKLLQARYEGRFPCKGVVTTVRKKK